MEDATPIGTASSEGGGAPAAPDAEDLTGKAIGDFHILRQLGQGGMGKVYLAEQVSLKRKVALKIMKAELAANATALVRFKKEAEAIARVTHANIVGVYAIGEHNGLHFMALEYVEGRNLREFLLKKGPPEVLLALSIMRQVAAALQRAGELGIVHRDIKPENILLTRKGEAKVADFGLSRCFDGDQPPLHITQSGVTMGTPLYMSPEQVQGKPVDRRSDIYSFGVTCYHMLTGEPPFRGATAFEVAMQHVQAEARLLQELRPDLPPDLCALVHRMILKNPDERYQSGREVLRELTRIRETFNGAGRTQAQAQPSMLSQSGIATLPPASDPLLGTKTGPIVQRKTGRWLLPAISASFLLALGLGAALGVASIWPGNPRPTTVVHTPPTTELPVPSSSREKFLLEAMKQEIKPDATHIMRALYDRIELGSLYLEQNRLDEADRLFVDLMKNPPSHLKPGEQDLFEFLGKVGHAIVLAFQDKTKESNKLFQKTLSDSIPEKKRFAPQSQYRLLNRPEFRMWIAKAVQHNADNEPLPSDLEYLRKPPPPTLGNPKLDKPKG